MYVNRYEPSRKIFNFDVAVTLDGTVIHKSGLITGGRSTRDSTKKWDETDVNGMFTLVLSRALTEADHSRLESCQGQPSYSIG